VSRVEISTATCPALLGRLCRSAPASPALNGGDGSPPREEAGAGDVCADPGGRVPASVLALADSSAGGVPARAAQWGASGPAGSHTASAAGVSRLRTAEAVRSPACRGHPGGQAPPQGSQHHGDAGRVDSQHPPQPGVRAGGEAVPERHRPADVRGPVHGAPGPVAEPDPHQAGEGHGEQQVKGHRAESEPERPVGGHERDEDVQPADRSERVQHCREDVNGQERHDQQRDVAMQAGGQQPWPGRAGEPHRHQQAEHDAGREQDQGQQAGAPARVPQRRWRPSGRENAHPPAAALAGWSSPAGQPATWTTRPSWATSREGRPSPASQSTAGAPSTIAAVAAVLASTQSTAATLAVRQRPAAGQPVAGSTM